MTSRQAGRRISTIASERRAASRRKRGGARQAFRPKNAPPSPRERRRFLQLVACGGIFVLLVAVKLLLPGRMTAFNQRLSAALRQNMDVKSVFSAVGRAVSGEETVNGTLEDVYQAVFHPREDSEALETAASGGAPRFAETTALASLRAFRLEKAARASSIAGTDRGFHPGLCAVLRPKSAGECEYGAGHPGL